jgi:hypothetical protein
MALAPTVTRTFYLLAAAAALAMAALVSFLPS